VGAFCVRDRRLKNGVGTCFGRNAIQVKVRKREIGGVSSNAIFKGN